MAVGELEHFFEGNKFIPNVLVSQFDEGRYGIDFHKGHIYFKCDGNVDVVSLENKIKAINGAEVVESVIVNRNTKGIAISIDGANDAYVVMKKIGQILFDDKLITHDEMIGLYRALDQKTKGAVERKDVGKF